MASRGSMRRGANRRASAGAAAAKHALTESIGEARTIVYVHGIGRKPKASVLKCQWDRALFGYDLGERSRLAYWMNPEYYPTPSEGTCDSGDLIDEAAEAGPRGMSIAAQLEATSTEQVVDAITSNKNARRALLKIAHEIDRGLPAARARQVSTQAVEAKVLPLPEWMRRWVTRMLTGALLRDVNDFFYVEARRSVMRESVLERLRPGGGPFVVVGHSQGSMIAYDVLTRLDPDKYDVPLFVTIGSPLGITEVKDEIKRLTSQGNLAVPRCVGRWVNVADPLDPVALDKDLSGDYRPETKIEDFEVWNPDSPRNPHSGTGYLRTEPVRASVREAVDTALFQPVAGFVVARDVSRDMEDLATGARHEVLIELGDPAGQSGVTIDRMREQVVAAIRNNAKGVPADRLRIEPLRRFVAAELTREETEALAATVDLKSASSSAKSLRYIWKNARKTALLDVSSRTTQARPAHLGYGALGRDVHWAILDTGIAAHPHFQAHGNVVAQHDCTKPGPLAEKGVAPDQNGHGSHVAGIIAGAMDVKDGKGKLREMTGMAPEAKLHVYRVLDGAGSGKDSWIIKALDHIAETNERSGGLEIHGVNLSLGGPFDQSTYGCGHTPLCNELRRLWRQGVVVVLAAGNEGFVVLQSMDGPIDANMDLSIGDPANLEEAIAVGSIHKESPHMYGVSYFSSRGPTADGRPKPDLVAPGERILSCRHRTKKNPKMLDDLYVEMSGTSMAAPHVSGIIAGFLSVRREFIGYPDRVKQILIEGCTDLGRDRPQQGAGMPNLVKMLMNT